MKVHPVSETAGREARWALGGPLAVCIAATIQLSTMGDLDRSLSVAIVAFAIAIPLLSGALLIISSHTRLGIALEWWARGVIVFAGLVASAVGVGALFSHFGTGPLWIFILCSVLGLATWRRSSALLQRAEDVHPS